MTVAPTTPGGPSADPDPADPGSALPAHRESAPWPLPAAGLALAAAGSLACLSAAGPAHGVLFGACGVTALLTPPLAAADRGWRRPAVVAVTVAAGALAGPAAAALLGAGGGADVRLLAAAAAVVGPLALALAGLVATLRAVRATPAVAGAVVTFLALAWLGWPVWLSPWLVRPPLAAYDALAGRLSAPHPLLALDAAVARLGGVPWTEHRVMYNKLTVLGQHVLAPPPAGVGAAAAWHAGVGVAGLGAAALRRRRA